MLHIVHDKRAEQELARVKDQLSVILEAAGEGIYGLDAEGRATFINQAGAAMFGYRQEELLGRNLHELLHYAHPDGRPYAHEDCPIEAVLRDGRAHRGDDQLFWRKDGAPLPVSFTSSPIQEDGRVTGAVVVLSDVTDRRRAQEAVRASEERFRRAADSAGAVVYDIDLAHPEQAIVHGMDRLAGLTREEIRFELEWWKSRIHPDDLPGYLAQLNRQMEQGGVMKASFRLKHASGSWMWVQSSREVLLDRHGKAARVVGAIVDISHRLAADEALRESEERLRLALSAGQMGTWDVDLATERTRWDAHEYALLGLREGETTPSRDAFYACVHPDDRALIQQAVERAVAEAGDMDYEFRVVHPDGQLRWLAARGQVMKDERGRPLRIVGVNYDVTQRKRIEERLRSFTLELEWRVAERTRELVQSHDRLRALATELNLTEQRERKRLATDLHDYLAQLLALVRMKLGQLKRVPAHGQPELLAETEQVVNEALTYTRTLVTQLSPPVLHEFGLPVALQWLAEQMVRQELSVEVRQSVPDRLELPEDQAVLLFQSVRELLVNVRKHARTHRAVVTIDERQGELVIGVQDEGVGGAAPQPTRDGPTAASSKFGLFSIRERMLAIGGRFDFESVPGRGTTATLALLLGSAECRAPRAEQDRSTFSSALGPRSSALHGSLERIRVLLVDDHAMVREGLRGLLTEHADVEVVGEAWDGEEAVAFADRLRPDVIIMDVNMPRMDGLEATRRIKAAFRSIAVVGLSVNSSPQVEDAMRASGADAFLSKGAAGEQIYRTIVETAKRSVERESAER
ncbi:hypothetical protein NITMOv2_2556 [Nitrospira moscoviensis]|uniref:histidine kinase n=2 Tax=Nitrospira moscoviensis TaxID=42253 RepID=A0A0K2GDP5_NITMO|nr:hypothetical protein NITMOv2_2556 [Nitrospira moscoviensis]